MRYRRLGDTDVNVSEVGFGVWTVSTGWWGEVDEARSVKLLRLAHEKGINYFDTADTYGSAPTTWISCNFTTPRRTP